MIKMTKQEHDMLNELSAIYIEVIETSAMILYELERQFIERGCSLRQHAKQRNNRILSHIKALKQLTSDDMFMNEHQVFAVNWKCWDDMRRDAAYFARLILLIHDRTAFDNDFMFKVEAFVQNRKEQGLIPQELINKFIIR